MQLTRLTIAIALTGLIGLFAGSVSAQSQPMPIDEMPEKVRADLLAEIPGLDARNAHFFILIDASQSTDPLPPRFRQLYNFLVTYFMDDGDELTPLAFSRHPWSADTASLTGATVPCGRGEETHVALASYPVPPVSPDEQGTDMRKPVYAVLEHCRRQELLGNKLIVIIRLSDQPDTNRGEFAGGPPPFPQTPAEQQNFEELLSQLAARADGRPTEAVLNAVPYQIQGVGKPLHVAVWYSGDYRKFPIVPYPQLDRERGPWRYSEGVLRRVLWRHPKLLLRWGKAAEADSYVLYVSNDRGALARSLAQRQSIPGVRRIVIKADSARAVESMPGVLEKGLDPLALAGEQVQIDKPFWVALHIIRGDLEEGDDRPREVPPIRLPFMSWVSHWAWQLWPIFFLVGLMVYVFLPQIYHTVSLGNTRWHVICGRGGLSIRCVPPDEAGEHDDTAIRLLAPGRAAALEGETLTVLRAVPTWLPAKFRSSLVLEPTSVVDATIDGAPARELNQGRVNRIMLTARDGSGVTFSPNLEVGRFWQRYWKKLVPVLASLGVGVMLLVIALIGRYL